MLQVTAATGESADFRCKACGAEYAEHQALCTACQIWGAIDVRRHQRLSEVDVDALERMSTGIPELDDFYGGGLTATSVNLIGGPPGSGKSRLLLQVIERSGLEVMYAASEQSKEGLAVMAQSLGLSDDAKNRTRVDAGGYIEDVLDDLSDDVELLIIDSYQKMRSHQGGSPWEPIQAWARETKNAVILVGRFNKKKLISGTNDLSHDCDSDARFKRVRGLRQLRMLKNRYGPTEYEDSEGETHAMTLGFRMVDGQMVVDDE